LKAWEQSGKAFLIGNPHSLPGRRGTNAHLLQDSRETLISFENGESFQMMTQRCRAMLMRPWLTMHTLPWYKKTLVLRTERESSTPASFRECSGAFTPNSSYFSSTINRFRIQSMYYQSLRLMSAKEGHAAT
jgi:hypothetical protein